MLTVVASLRVVNELPIEYRITAIDRIRIN